MRKSRDEACRNGLGLRSICSRQREGVGRLLGKNDGWLTVELEHSLVGCREAPRPVGTTPKESGRQCEARGSCCRYARGERSVQGGW